MPNDTLDEIWARWKRGDEGPPPDIRTLIEMVRARDRVVAEAANGWVRLKEWYDGADKERAEMGEVGSIHRDNFEAWLDCLVEDARAALDTPPAQEPAE